MVLAHKTFDATNDATGAILTNVDVRVQLEAGGLVSLYSDRAGATPIGNPATFADGKVDFYCAGGAYKITLTQGDYSRVLRYQANGLLAERDSLTPSAVGVPFTPASASGPASFDFSEDTDNGTNKTTVQAAAALGADNTVTLPAATGTLVTGATTTVDNVVVRFDGTGGAIQGGAPVSIADNGEMVLGPISGGTYNGNVQVFMDDRYPSIRFRAGGTIKASITADVTSSALVFGDFFHFSGATLILQADVNGLTMGAPIRLKNYTVATLPAGQAGDMAYASNGRALAGSTGAANLTMQGAGAGTGCLVVRNGSNWQVAGLNTTVAS